MNDRQTAQRLLNLYHNGVAMLWGPIPAKLREGTAALISDADEGGHPLVPAFYRRGRWETALREPVHGFAPTQWGRFPERLMTAETVVVLERIPGHGGK
jgi:hypothetical protein